MPKLTEAQIEEVIAHIQKYPEFYDQLFNSKYGAFTKNSNSSIFAVLDAESTQDTDVIVDVLVKIRDSLAKITKYNQQKTATYRVKIDLEQMDAVYRAINNLFSNQYTADKKAILRSDANFDQLRQALAQADRPPRLFKNIIFFNAFAEKVCTHQRTPKVTTDEYGDIYSSMDYGIRLRKKYLRGIINVADIYNSKRVAAVYHQWLNRLLTKEFASIKDRHAAIYSELLMVLSIMQEFEKNNYRSVTNKPAENFKWLQSFFQLILKDLQLAIADITGSPRLSAIELSYMSLVTLAESGIDSIESFLQYTTNKTQLRETDGVWSAPMTTDLLDRKELSFAIAAAGNPAKKIYFTLSDSDSLLSLPGKNIPVSLQAAAVNLLVPYLRVTNNNPRKKIIETASRSTTAKFLPMNISGFPDACMIKPSATGENTILKATVTNEDASSVATTFTCDFSGFPLGPGDVILPANHRGQLILDCNQLFPRCSENAVFTLTPAFNRFITIKHDPNAPGIFYLKPTIQEILRLEAASEHEMLLEKFNINIQIYDPKTEKQTVVCLVIDRENLGADLTIGPQDRIIATPYLVVPKQEIAAAFTVSDLKFADKLQDLATLLTINNVERILAYAEANATAIMREVPTLHNGNFMSTLNLCHDLFLQTKEALDRVSSISNINPRILEDAFKAYALKHKAMQKMLALLETYPIDINSTNLQTEELTQLQARLSEINNYALADDTAKFKSILTRLIEQLNHSDTQDFFSLDSSSGDEDSVQHRPHP